MDIGPIKSEDDYREALAEAEALMVAEPGMPEGEKLVVLTALLEAYERDHYPMGFRTQERQNEGRCELTRS